MATSSHVPAVSMAIGQKMCVLADFEYLVWYFVVVNCCCCCCYGMDQDISNQGLNKMPECPKHPTPADAESVCHMSAVQSSWGACMPADQRTPTVGHEGNVVDSSKLSHSRIGLNQHQRPSNDQPTGMRQACRQTGIDVLRVFAIVLTADLSLLITICMPILLHGLEALPLILNKSQLSSLDFTINRLHMKLVTSNDMQTIQFCRLQFNFKLSSEQIAYRCKNCASSEFLSMNLANVSCVQTGVYFIICL